MCCFKKRKNFYFMRNLKKRKIKFYLLIFFMNSI